MIFFLLSVHFQLGYPKWALPEGDGLDSRIQLGGACEVECAAAGVKILQGSGGKILDDHVTNIKE